MSWLWYSSYTPTTQTISLSAGEITLQGGDIDPILASEDRPTGLTAKVFRGTDHRHPQLLLTGARNRTGQIRLTNTGSGGLDIPNRHADRNLLLPDDLVRYEMDGLAFHQWAVTADHSATHRPTEAEQVTSFSGPGVLGLLAEGIVFPTGGVGRKPIERDRVWGWMSPSPIYDDSGWGQAIQLTNGITDWWSGPTQFPGGLASGLGSYWIWGNALGVDTTWAPQGDCFFRKTFVTTEERRYAFFFMADDRANVYIDGQLQIESESWTNDNLSVFSPQFDLSVGTHSIAVWAQNNPGQIGNNPSGIRGVLCPIDPDTGEISGTPILVTDNTWKCLAYPWLPPGMTIGEVLINVFQENQDTYGLLEGWELSFTKTHDSNGNSWTEYSEYGTRVGNDLRTFILDELGSTFIDVRAQNGGLVLDVCVIDTMGVDRVAGLVAPTTRSQPETGNILSMDHDREAKKATSLLVLSQYGWDWIDSTPPGERKKAAFLSIGSQPSQHSARAVAAGELARFSTTRESISATTRKVDIRNADIGDRIPAVDRNGDPVTERVIAWTFKEDEHGTLTWIPELKDLIMQGDERRENALKKMADGTIRGASRVATPASQVQTDDSCCAPTVPPAA